MNDTATNPIIVCSLFILRCVIPILIMFGITALLKHWGLIGENRQPPPGYENNDLDNSEGG